MKSGKKLLVLCLTLCLVIAGAVGMGGGKTADASIMEKDVAKDFIESGVQNIMDWKKTGETADKSYRMNAKGDVLAARGQVSHGTASFMADKTTLLSEKRSESDAEKTNIDLKIEFDLFEFDVHGFDVLVEDTTTFAYMPLQLLNNSALKAKAENLFYKDSELTQAYPTAASGAIYAWFYLFTCPEYGNHVEYTIRTDGTCGIKTTPLKADGTLNNDAPESVATSNGIEDYQNRKNEIWIKNAYKDFSAAGQINIGLLFGAKNLVLDNYKTSTYWADNGELKEILNDTIDFTPGENPNTLKDGRVIVNTFSSKPTEKQIMIYAGAGKAGLEEIVELVAQPANSDRIVTDLKIIKDSSKAVENAFEMNAQFKFTKLGKKFGLAFGLSEKNAEISGEKVSYLYFTQIKDEGADAYKTGVAVRNGSSESEPVSLGADLMDGKFHDFNILCKKDGKAALTVDGAEDAIKLQIDNADGHVAIVTEGDGEAEVSVGGKTNIKGYEFKGSNGEAVQNNFNSGWVNPKNWTMNSKPAVMLKNAEDKKGVTLDGGMFRFNGAGDGSYIATVGQYADFVLEFKLREYADKPEQTREKFLNSALAVNIGCSATTHGWEDSNMFFFLTNIKEEAVPDGGLSELYTGSSNVRLNDFKSDISNPSVTNGNIKDYEFMPRNPGETKVTAIKMVAYNNVISVWYQEVKDGEVPSAGKYKKVDTDYKVKDTFGRIAFAVTDCAFFDIDDIRIVPIDDPDPEIMKANLDAFVDFAQIADEHRPVALAAPELKIDGSTVSWNKIDNVSGYVIDLNGVKIQLGADVTSYEITESGEYTVTVTAKGDGVRYDDSDESEPLEFTYTAAGSTEPGSKKGCGGCGSSAGAYALGGGLVLLAAAGGLLFAKRKQN